MWSQIIWILKSSGRGRRRFRFSVPTGEKAMTVHSPPSRHIRPPYDIQRTVQREIRPSNTRCYFQENKQIIESHTCPETSSSSSCPFRSVSPSSAADVTPQPQPSPSHRPKQHHFSPLPLPLPLQLHLQHQPSRSPFPHPALLPRDHLVKWKSEPWKRPRRRPCPGCARARVPCWTVGGIRQRPKGTRKKVSATPRHISHIADHSCGKPRTAKVPAPHGLPPLTSLKSAKMGKAVL